jgi:hypothetical protein
MKLSFLKLALIFSLGFSAFGAVASPIAPISGGCDQFAVAPPPGETEAQKKARCAQEASAAYDQCCQQVDCSIPANERSCDRKYEKKYQECMAAFVSIEDELFFQ